ncbi:(2Fe-2S)-binding protein [Roseovarius sp. M141]|uniref:(2Fe-2S)-binding protein n=1 Tax=Roseovarius sp. M141 TaxID=2583806 RepID=UPI0020CE8CE1|nr:(2Fe-2S)-binding protein [Roseovarius sp. M141]MCQ0093996.1 (2Fe-2S)-binding protein [Roseovarius sp. M141]
MKIASRFLTPPETGEVVQFHYEGEAITAPAGLSLAAALLAHSGAFTRQTVNGAPRTAFCMMGVCFDCLVEVDGMPNTQACMIRVRSGMVVKRQMGLRGLSGGNDV